MKLHTDLLREQLDRGWLLRNQWSSFEPGRVRLCAYTALLADPDARPSTCPADAMPRWLAELIPVMDDEGTIVAWPKLMRRLANVADKWGILSPDAWARVHNRVRAGIIREALKRVTTDSPSIRNVCEDMIAALERGTPDDVANARATAMCVLPEPGIAMVARAAVAAAVADTVLRALKAVPQPRKTADAIITMILEELEIEVASVERPT